MMINLNIQLFGGRGRKAGNGIGGAPLDFDENGKVVYKTHTSKEMNNFRNLNDKKFSKLIEKAKSANVPKNLNQESLLQRVVYMSNLNDKPTILNEHRFNNYAKDNDLILCYRGVRDTATLSGEQIHEMTKYSDDFYVGNGIHGDGLYFTTSSLEAANYGESVMSIAIKKDAKIISKKDALELYEEEKRNNTRVGESLRNYTHQRRLGSKAKSANIIALQKGFDIIKVEGGNAGDGTTDYKGDFYIVLNRAAVIIKE